MESKLYSVEEVKSFINQNKLMSLAGDEKVLNRLPKGNWIAGTIPYFMDEDAGKFEQNQIFVNELDDNISNFKIKVYDENNIEDIVNDSFDNGFSLVIMPPFQEVHQEFALKAENIEGLYNNPLVGWIAGVDLNVDANPKTYNGITGEKYEDKAVVLHIELPNEYFAQIDIVNIFEPDTNSPEIRFFFDTFDVLNCLIDGKEVNLAEYIDQNNIDTKLPLIADYSGAHINVSIKEVDVSNGLVSFFAPVFQSKVYKFAKPINNYIKRFEIKTLDYNTNNVFSCNCILNYLYGDFEGRKINNIKGPITFGEIGYQLLNQTLVSLTVDKN